MRVDVTERLSSDQVREVLRVATAAETADGTYPLSEHTVLHLKHGGGDPVRHVLLTEGAGLAGYAHVDVSDEVDGPSAELVVDPAHRGKGLGRALAKAAVEATPDGRLRLWAHGEHPAAAALARSLGFTRTRVLLQLRRSLAEPIPEPVLADGVTLRAFEPGRDEAAWLAVNARAFAHHPEQGTWTARDLAIRETEPWFDPAGFLLAERAGELAGFHWTKVHGAGGHEHEPIGEVYVLGVDPSAQGLGLGRALTLAGLLYLRKRGLRQAMLYVDESNTAALALYTRLGFTRWATDVSFQL